MKYLKRHVVSALSLSKKLNVLSVYEKILIISIVLYIVVLSAITSLRHYCFQTFAFDFGIFLQIFWNSLNGNFMFTQPRGTPMNPRSFLGVHVSPLLILFLPVYAVARSPYTLLVIQSIFLALPALFVYKIALKVIGKKDVAMLFGVAYLIHPATIWSNWYDFHLEAFVPLFLSMMYYYYFSRSKVNLIISMIFLLSTFETSVAILVFFIFYVFVRELIFKVKNNKKRSNSQSMQKGEWVMLLLMGVFAVAYFLLSERLMLNVWPERNTYEPARIFGKINYNALLVKLSFLLILTAPLAFLSFNSPLELLPSAPYLFLAMATDYEPYYTINWQYPALIIVPFMVSGVLGYFKDHPEKVKLKLVTASLISLILFSPATPLMSQFSKYWGAPVPTEEIFVKHKALSFIRGNSSVLAQENLFPHLVERKVVYSVWPAYLDPPDYIVVDVLDSFQFYHEPVIEPVNRALFKFVNNYDYGVAIVANGLLILERGYQSQKNVLMPLHCSLRFEKLRRPFVSFQDYFKEASWHVPDWVNVSVDHLLLKKGFIGNAWWGPYVTVPPGKYRVEVKLSVDEEVVGQAMDILVYYWDTNEVYAKKSIFGDQLKIGETVTFTLDFELTKWVPAIEVVGMSYGLADVRVQMVRFEMIE